MSAVVETYGSSVEEQLAEAKARLADIAYGATVQLEGRSVLTPTWTLREIKRVASAPL